MLSPAIQRFRFLPDCWIQDWRSAWSCFEMVNALKVPACQMMVEYCVSALTGVAGQS